MINDYMTKDYECARERYYTLVQAAEVSIIPIKQNIFPQSPSRQLQSMSNNEITTEMVVEAMQKISHALVFRAESYTCAPTIMHVVRVLQSSKDLQEKYKTITPQWCADHEDIAEATVICKIGRFGYLMSMLEQLGYMYRFHLTYCNDHKDSEKCDKKKEKYQKRLNDAVMRYNNIAHTWYSRRAMKKQYGPKNSNPVGGSRNTLKRRSKQTLRKRGGKRHTRKPKKH
jgi:hypothetical protein